MFFRVWPGYVVGFWSPNWFGVVLLRKRERERERDCFLSNSLCVGLCSMSLPHGAMGGPCFAGSKASLFF